ncbi:hypothetical protein PInf_007148 [Phytophthora infestans]|nr:hypothetical protein PInf_007148 [Phytophthora infestans]
MGDGQATSADTDSRTFPSGKRKRSTDAKVRARKGAPACSAGGIQLSGLGGGASVGESARDPSSDKARGWSGVAAGERVADDGAARADAARVSDVTKEGAAPTSNPAAALDVLAATATEQDYQDWLCRLCTVGNRTAARCDFAPESPDREIEEQATATDQTATATDQADTEPYQAATATDQGTATTDTSELYFRVYGEYYGPSRVTVVDKFATTKQTWQIARLVNRRESKLGFEYRVLWVVYHRHHRRYYQRTQPLLEDGFEEEIALVDRWKDSDVSEFDKFCKQDEFGAKLAGRPDIATQMGIDDFVEKLRKEYGLDLPQGTSWAIFLEFMRGLRDARRDFIFKALVKNNFVAGGRRGYRVFEKLELRDGFYLCVAYNDSFTGHAFVLHGVMIPDQATWINLVSFVRPFIVFTKKYVYHRVVFA